MLAILLISWTDLPMRLSSRSLDTEFLCLAMSRLLLVSELASAGMTLSQILNHDE